MGCGGSGPAASPAAHILGDFCCVLIRRLVRFRDSSEGRAESGFPVNPGGRPPSHVEEMRPVKVKRLSWTLPVSPVCFF